MSSIRFLLDDDKALASFDIRAIFVSRSTVRLAALKTISEMAATGDYQFLLVATQDAMDELGFSSEEEVKMHMHRVGVPINHIELTKSTEHKVRVILHAGTVSHMDVDFAVIPGLKGKLALTLCVEMSSQDFGESEAMRIIAQAEKDEAGDEADSPLMLTFPMGDDDDKYAIELPNVARTPSRKKRQAAPSDEPVHLDGEDEWSKNMLTQDLGPLLADITPVTSREEEVMLAAAPYIWSMDNPVNYLKSNRTALAALLQLVEALMADKVCPICDGGVEDHSPGCKLDKAHKVALYLRTGSHEYLEAVLIHEAGKKDTE